jgi:hypothetical protein
VFGKPSAKIGVGLDMTLDDSGELAGLHTYGDRHRRHRLISKFDSQLQIAFH